MHPPIRPAAPKEPLLITFIALRSGLAAAAIRVVPRLVCQMELDGWSVLGASTQERTLQACKQPANAATNPSYIKMGHG